MSKRTWMVCCVNIQVFKTMWYNTTVSADEITAANIDHYLDGAEKINKGNKK